MKTRALSIIATIGLLFGTGAVLLHALGQPEQGVTVFNNGRVWHFKQSSAASAKLQSLAEQLVTSANTVTFEGVEPTLIHELTTSGQSIEIIYPQPVSLSTAIAGDAGTIRIDRLLIRTAGSHRGWVLYGNGKWENGPFVITDGPKLDQVNQLLTGKSL